MDTLKQEAQNPYEQAVFPAELSSEAQRKLDAIMRLLEPCASRQEYGQRLRVHQYNQDIDHRTHQTRYQRWEVGLMHTPVLPNERELDICLMKQATRRMQRSGHISFESIVYKGENLAGYAGKQVALRSILIILALSLYIAITKIRKSFYQGPFP
jgi:hypothetical protein